MLQDMADIQAEEDRRKTWGFIGAIPGCAGGYGLAKTVFDFSQGDFLGSLEGLGLFVVMLLPMFICGAKTMGGLGGGIIGIIFCLMPAGYFLFELPKAAAEKAAAEAEAEAKKAEAEAKEAEIAANKAAFEALISQLKSLEGRKANDCIGYWKSNEANPLNVSKKGKKYTVKYLDGDGKDVELSGVVSQKRICNEETNTCHNAKELICKDYYCIIAKGDSAYFFDTTAPFLLLGYARTDKSEFDKKVKEIRESSSK